MHPVEKSREREKKVVEWLESIRHEAEEIYLVGDIFDYWFEYKRVVPRGFTRFLGKIAEITDSGIKDVTCTSWRPFIAATESTNAASMSKFEVTIA